MQVYVARQPIFDRRLRVYGYELLFRSGHGEVFDAQDGDQATSRVISDSLLVFGSGALTRGKRAFINFTRDLLVAGQPLLLPREWVVIEVLETVEPGPEVLDACQELKKAGYALALDDFIYHPRFDPLLELADVVKVDLLALAEGELPQQVRLMQRFSAKLLAEKVETRRDYQQCLDLGFSYFQGYFFSKPVVVGGRNVPGFKLTYLRMLNEINQPDVNFGQLEAIIRQDVSLSYKLLRYINSVGFGLLSEVKSIQQALVLLGQRNVQKWASLVALTHLGQDKPDELLVSSIVRARFCENLAGPAGLPDQAQDLFLMGLFSQIDALLDRPLESILQDMPIDKLVKVALTGHSGRLGQVYRLIQAYERADWPVCQEAAVGLGLDEAVLPEGYLAALEWTRQLEMV